MNHATIKLGDYTIPLIGVDRTATLEECDLCHDIFSIQAVRLEGTQILCDKCRTTYRYNLQGETVNKQQQTKPCNNNGPKKNA